MAVSYGPMSSAMRRRSTPLLPPASPLAPHTPALDYHVENHDAGHLVAWSPSRRSRKTFMSDWETFVEIELGLHAQRTKPLRIVKNERAGSDEQLPPPLPPKDWRGYVRMLCVKKSAWADLETLYVFGLCEFLQGRICRRGTPAAAGYGCKCKFLCACAPIFVLSNRAPQGSFLAGLRSYRQRSLERLEMDDYCHCVSCAPHYPVHVIWPPLTWMF
jgi:hypothetical protein